MDRGRGRARARGQSGQVAVETALVLPLFVFMVLGVVQLTALEQARLLTEFAAFQAARAGIVWNGNVERMQDAARMALIPTFGRSDGPEALGATWQRFVARDRAFRELPWSGPNAVNGVSLKGLVRVDTLNPSWSSGLASAWKLRGGDTWEELDFDVVNRLPESPELSQHLSRYFGVELSDPSEAELREATLLTIRLRYWYELDIPFANAGLFLAWFAGHAGVDLRGAVDRPSVRANANVTAARDVPDLSAEGLANAHGLPTTTRADMAVLWALASGDLPLPDGAGHRYFVPVSATHSMRLQSNFHRKWLTPSEDEP